MNARVRATREGDVDVLRFTGEVDHQTAPALERDALLATRESTCVVLDLSGLTWFDSAGVTLLDRLVRSCGQRGIKVQVSVPDHGPARTVLRIVAFPEALVSPDVASALHVLAR